VSLSSYSDCQYGEVRDTSNLYLNVGLEKTKGNESFRISDNNDAVLCYSRSIAYDATSALVWANRAMAYIRLELYDLAEADSSVAIKLDSRYTKAYSRRGLVRFKRGKYADVMMMYRECLLSQSV